MRKHRVLAGILAAIMLLGMVPSALAADTGKSCHDPHPQEVSFDNLRLAKFAESLNNSQETTVNLIVSAPSDQNQVAVEFVLDGTSSLHEEGDLGLIKQTAAAIKNTFSKSENVYVGITVFGRKAETVLSMKSVDAITENANEMADNLSEQLKNLDTWLGSNVQAGIHKGLADLQKAPEGSKKYMVLVTDGGSYWWLDGEEPANNTYYTGAGAETAPLMNNDAAEGGYDELTPFEELIKLDLDSKPETYGDASAHEPLAAAVQQIKEKKASKEEKAYTNFETGIYWAAKELEKIPGDVNLITVGKEYYPNKGIKALTTLAGDFVDMAIEKDTTGFSKSLRGLSLDAAMDEIAAKLSIAVPAGSVIVDRMGKTVAEKGDTEKYDFNLRTDAMFTLRVDAKGVATQTYEAAMVNNVVAFADGSTLEYVSGSDEHFVFTLGQDIYTGGQITLIYKEKLVNYDTSSGHHDVRTNVDAILDTVPVAENGKYEGVAFPEPILSYREGSGSNGGGTIIPDDEVPKAELNETDHYAYIIGRKDGLVHPEANITRGEVATIYFRMLTDESRNELWSQSNPYTDVHPDTWCNAAVSTMSRAGVIQGFSDGTFRPYAPITRAQFATIAVRFFEVVYAGEDKFTDIADHWAKDYINKAAEAALINGFSDGTFRPNQNITRAQAMAIFNRVLGRAPEKDHLLPDDMITWPDNMNKSAWYYANMQEATNSHEYEVRYDAEGNPYEVWTKILPVRDWAAFEKEWSTVNSAANPGEVISVPVNVKK